MGKLAQLVHMLYCMCSMCSSSSKHHTAVHYALGLHFVMPFTCTVQWNFLHYASARCIVITLRDTILVVKPYVSTDTYCISRRPNTVTIATFHITSRLTKTIWLFVPFHWRAMATVEFVHRCRQYTAPAELITSYFAVCTYSTAQTSARSAKHRP